MWNTRKMLLASIVFTALFYKAESAKVMDMAPDAVDDMYNGCRNEALEKFVHSGLLKQELNSSKEFQEAWTRNTACSKLIPGGTKEHMAALLAYYVEENQDFSKTFDNAVQTTGGNVSTYENQFHYKSLHFLLMDSMWLLEQKECKTVYVVQEDYTAKEGSKVRFGKFTKVWSSYRSMQNMVDFDGQFVFNITSCYFINPGANICTADQDMVLLSPTEEFTVEAVNKLKDSINESEYTGIVLKHSSLNSTHNCYILSRSPADVSSQWLVLMLVILSLFFFN
ncbi:erythroblast NAD(P)(+)--arginine ADP-ribosyltransferase isoform X2 [Eleginops maclovinus]